MSRVPRHPKLSPVTPIGVAAISACAAAGAWALWPTGSSTVPSPERVLASLQPATPPIAPAQAEPMFNTAAFHTPLWVAVAPEPMPVPEPPTPPPPPLRATLLAIARDASHAIVHNQDTDAILTLRVGDRVQGRLVARIEPSRVTLTLEGRPQTLELGYAVGAASQTRLRRDAAATQRSEAAP